MSVQLSEEDLERLGQRVAELLFHKIMGRVAKAAAVPPLPKSQREVREPTDEDIARLRARRRRLGRLANGRRAP